MGKEVDSQTVVWDGLFTLDLPDGWTWSDEDAVISIFREPDGVGVLQISFAHRRRHGLPSFAEAAELAESFADQRGWDLTQEDVHSIEVTGCPASEFEFTEHGDRASYWQVWNIVGLERAAFATYTCDPSDLVREADDRWRIVRSFRWL